MTTPSLPLPRSLRQFLAQSACWTALCACSELFCRFVLHLGYPYNYPAVPPRFIFGDLRFFRSKFPFFHSRAFFTHGEVLPYPAPTVALFKLFFPSSSPLARGPLPTLTFLLILLIVSAAMMTMLRQALVARDLATRFATLFCTGCYLLSFPLWFDFHQANMEFFVWVILCIALWAHWTSRSWLAAVFLGAAAAMKLYPVVFLGLLLARKQYRQFAVALTCAAAITLLGLWLVCPDIPYTWHQTGLALSSLRNEHFVVLDPIVSGFDHTLWVLLKRLFPVLPVASHLDRLLDIYLTFVALAGVALFFTRIVKLPTLNQFLCISIAAVLFTPVSFDYTLLQLYPAFALILFASLQQRGRPSRVLVAALALFAFILSAQSEFILHGMRFAGSIKAVALLALFVLGASCPIALEPLHQTSAVENRSQQPLLV